MAWGDANVAGVSRDLLSIESSALAAVRGYGQYLRDAENAGLPEVAYFVRQLMEEDSARAAHCRGLLERLSASSETGSAAQLAGRKH
jgi:rubrerythrin